jgi:hypothetical protein
MDKSKKEIQPLADDEPYKRKYMREYKRRKYAENADKMKDINKAYYCKYRNNISTEEMGKYGACLPLVIKIHKALDELEKRNNPLFRTVLTDILETKNV